LVLHASLVALFLKIPGTLLALGFAAGTVWRFYLLLVVSSLLTAGPLLLWLEKKKAANRKIGLLVFAIFLSECGLYFFSRSMWGLGISLWMFFSAFNCLEASLPSLVSKLAPPASKGTALGIYSSIQFIGLFLGGLAGGWLDNDYGMVGVLGFCVALTVGWLVYIIVNLKEDTSNGARFK
jgi:predicted MFS family arabinose efflux permease